MQRIAVRALDKALRIRFGALALSSGGLSSFPMGFVQSSTCLAESEQKICTIQVLRELKQALSKGWLKLVFLLGI